MGMLGGWLWALNSRPPGVKFNGIDGLNLTIAGYKSRFKSRFKVLNSMLTKRTLIVLQHDGTFYVI